MNKEEWKEFMKKYYPEKLDDMQFVKDIRLERDKQWEDAIDKTCADGSVKKIKAWLK